MPGYGSRTSFTKLARITYVTLPYILKPKAKYLNGQKKLVIVSGATDGIG